MNALSPSGSKAKLVSPFAKSLSSATSSIAISASELKPKTPPQEDLILPTVVDIDDVRSDFKGFGGIIGSSMTADFNKAPDSPTLVGSSEEPFYE